MSANNGSEAKLIWNSGLSRRFAMNAVNIIILAREYGGESWFR